MCLCMHVLMAGYNLLVCLPLLVVAYRKYSFVCAEPYWYRCSFKIEVFFLLLTVLFCNGFFFVTNKFFSITIDYQPV